MKALVLVAVAAAALLGAASAASAPKAQPICVGKGPKCSPTLAAALAAAHDGDTIQLGPGNYAGGVTIDASISLVGAGAGRTTISGGGPVLTIGQVGGADNDQLHVSISGVTVTGGDATSAPTRDGSITFVALGGGVLIPSDAPPGTVGATVTIQDSAITGNRATPTSTTDSGDSCPGGDCAFAQGIGGGIADIGKLTLVDTVVSGNVAGGPLASNAEGGGIWTATAGGPGALTLIDSTVTNNQASVSRPNGRFAEGGGIQVQDGETFVVQNSTVSNNTASVSNTFPTGVEMNADSGGIHIGGVGSATIENSQITGNTASADDPSGFPGAFDAGLSDGLSDFCACGQTLDLENTVISYNRTIANVASSDNGPSDSAVEIDGQATVSNTTISDNTTTVTSHHGSASALGAFFAFDGDAGSIVMTDSTIANNTVTVSAHGGPGTIQGAGVTNGAALELHNVQVTGNSAHANGPNGSYAQGGGIWNGQPFGPDGNPTPQLTLANTHVTGNLLTGGPGVLLQGGGLYTVGFPVTLDKSQIDHNRPDDCVGC
jgi:hypothetical protein